jgi:hypothetical protein
MFPPVWTGRTGHGMRCPTRLSFFVTTTTMVFDTHPDENDRALRRNTRALCGMNSMDPSSADFWTVRRMQSGHSLQVAVVSRSLFNHTLLCTVLQITQASPWATQRELPIFLCESSILNANSHNHTYAFQTNRLGSKRIDRIRTKLDLAQRCPVPPSQQPSSSSRSP